VELCRKHQATLLKKCPASRAQKVLLKMMFRLSKGGVYITPLRYNSLPLKKDKLPGSSSSFGGYVLPMLMMETSPLHFLMGFHGRSLIALFQHGCPSFSVEGSNFGCEHYTPDKNWPGPQKCSLSAGGKLLCLYKPGFLGFQPFVWQIKVYGNPLYKKCKNPGGDWHLGWVVRSNEFLFWYSYGGV